MTWIFTHTAEGHLSHPISSKGLIETGWGADAYSVKDLADDDYIKRLTELTEALHSLELKSDPEVDDPPAAVLAYDLTEIEDACAALTQYISRLRANGHRDALQEIQDEVRHMAWHLQSPELRFCLEVER